MNNSVKFIAGTMLAGLVQKSYFQALWHGIPCGLATALAAWCFTAADGASVPVLRALPGIRRTPNERAGDAGAVPAESQDDVVTVITRPPTNP